MNSEHLWLKSLPDDWSPIPVLQNDGKTLLWKQWWSILYKYHPIHRQGHSSNVNLLSPMILRQVFGYLNSRAPKPINDSVRTAFEAQWLNDMFIFVTNLLPALSITLSYSHKAMCLLIKIAITFIFGDTLGSDDWKFPSLTEIDNDTIAYHITRLCRGNFRNFSIASGPLLREHFWLRKLPTEWLPIEIILNNNHSPIVQKGWWLILCKPDFYPLYRQDKALQVTVTNLLCPHQLLKVFGWINSRTPKIFSDDYCTDLEREWFNRVKYYIKNQLSPGLNLSMCTLKLIRLVVKLAIRFIFGVVNILSNGCYDWWSPELSCHDENVMDYQVNRICNSICAKREFQFQKHSRHNNLFKRPRIEVFETAPKDAPVNVRKIGPGSN